MNTRQHHIAWVDKALRSRKADFFKVDGPKSQTKAPPQDQKPLQRALNMNRRTSRVTDNSENMCAALWELNARN